MKIKTQVVEKIDSKEITQICLENDNGLEASFLTLGATWQSFLIPLNNELKKDIILGFDKPSDYLKNSLCAGQSIGRVAGRIDKGRASIGGKVIQLPQNEKGNCLHGGFKGFHKQVWDYKVNEGPDNVSVTMFYRAKEENDGFPGDMTVEVTFMLDNTNQLKISYKGYGASQTTLFNPTNHAYFNLSQSQNLMNHTLIMKSDSYLETREDVVPTGNILSVENTPYNFREGKNLGKAIIETGGFDDAFIVPSNQSQQVILTDDESGDTITMSSNRNAFVVYTMNSIDGGIYPSRDRGQEAKAYEAIALEAQILPDAINHNGFGDIILEADQTKQYDITIAYSKKD